MLGKLFRPRWQHQNAAQRLRAIHELSLDDPQSGHVLATLARGDSDSEVRAAAAGRLPDLKLLDHLISQDTSDTVRTAAAEQLHRLLAGLAEHCPALDNRLRLVQLTDNQGTLLYVARQSPDAACRLAATERLTDPAALLELALHGQDPAQRISAAERIQDATTLRQLVREGRDKRVQQSAREKLREHQQAAQASEERQRARDAILAEITQHAGRQIDNLYGPRLAQLRQQWQQASEGASGEAQRHFNEQAARCDALLAAREQAQAEQARKETLHTEQQAAIDGLLALRGELTAEVFDSHLGSLRAAVAMQTRRWQAATEEHPADAPTQARYTGVLEGWQLLLAAADELQTRQQELADLCTALQAGNGDDTLLAEARQWLAQWPADAPRPSLLVSLADQLTLAQPAREPVREKREARRAPRSSEQEALDNLLGAVQRELRQRNLRHANRLWHKAEALLAEHPDSSRAARMEKLRPELDELRDWHAFAAEPKKDDLCARMEALASEAMDAEEKATAIQALHDEWRSLMSSNQDIDQALWERFKAASDIAYEPCREHFREQDAERAANLAKRAALCDQLDALLASQAQHPEQTDWPALFEIRRQAPQEFREYQPVRFTDARGISRRFSQLLSTLDERLEQASARHGELLEQYCVQVEQLLEQSDLRTATDQARQLQQQWKHTGWVHPQRYRGLHKRFRKACDALFGRQQAERDAQRQQHAQDKQMLAAALEQFGAALPTLDSAALREQIQALEALPCPRREQHLLKQRDQLLQQARATLAAWPKRQRWQKLSERVAAAPDSDTDDTAQRELAVALEVSADVESPADAREERMRWQLEKLPQAMKRANPDRLEECARLLDDAEALLAAGLHPVIRSRLQQALARLAP